VKKIIIVENVFIQLCCKVSLTQNVCLGFMNLDGKEPCMNGLFVNSQKLQKIIFFLKLPYKLIEYYAYLV
jgi:hypothetical protein